MKKKAKEAESITQSDMLDNNIIKASSKLEGNDAGLEKIKNSYRFRCGALMVNLHFSDDAPSLEEALLDYLLQAREAQ